MQRRLALAAVLLVVASATALADDPGKDKGPDFSSKKDNPDGSTLYTVGRKLPTEWTTKVGVDVGVPADQRTTYDLSRPVPLTADQQSGAGWANVTTPSLDTALGADKMSVDAKVDPLQEQSKLGTTFSHSVPVGTNLAVTVENGYAVTRSMPGPVANPTQPQEFWTNDRTVKFDVRDTGTSFLAGTSTSTVDNVTHQKLGAEQKLFGDFNVKTQVTDFGTTAANKSITAGFKKTW